MERLPLSIVHLPLCVSPIRRQPVYVHAIVWTYSRGLVIPFPFPICDPANVQTDDVPVRSASRLVLHRPSLPDCSFHSNRGIKLTYRLFYQQFPVQNCSKITILFFKICKRESDAVRTYSDLLDER